MHSHTQQEEISRTVHWGYTKDCWRYALYLDPETAKDEDLVKAFENFIVDEDYVEDEMYPQWFSRIKGKRSVAEEENQVDSFVDIVLSLPS